MKKRMKKLTHASVWVLGEICTGAALQRNDAVLFSSEPDPWHRGSTVQAWLELSSHKVTAVDFYTSFPLGHKIRRFEGKTWSKMERYNVPPLFTWYHDKESWCEDFDRPHLDQRAGKWILTLLWPVNSNEVVGWCHQELLKDSMEPSREFHWFIPCVPWFLSLI